MLAAHIFDDSGYSQYVCWSFHASKPLSKSLNADLEPLEDASSFTVLKHRRRPKFGDFWIVDRFWCGKKHLELFYSYYRTTTWPS